MATHNKSLKIAPLRSAETAQKARGPLASRYMQMRQLILLIAFVISFPASSNKHIPNTQLLLEYFSFLVKETIWVEKGELVGEIGVPVVVPFSHKNGHMYFAVATQTKNNGCRLVLLRYNPEGMGFFTWLERWGCKNTQEVKEKYSTLNGSEFHFASEDNGI